MNLVVTTEVPNRFPALSVASFKCLRITPGGSRRLGGQNCPNIIMYLSNFWPTTNTSRETPQNVGLLVCIFGLNISAIEAFITARRLLFSPFGLNERHMAAWLVDSVKLSYSGSVNGTIPMSLFDI